MIVKSSFSRIILHKNFLSDVYNGSCGEQNVAFSATAILKKNILFKATFPSNFEGACKLTFGEQKQRDVNQMEERILDTNPGKQQS